MGFLAQASEDAAWLRTVAKVPPAGATTWSIVVTTGHFGGDPQLAGGTRRKITELMAEVGARADRVRVYAAEMSVWGSPVEVPIEDLASALPVSQAPKSKGGRDIELILRQVGREAQGPVLVFSPGASILPVDGSGSLAGGDGTVDGFENPEKRTILIPALPKDRYIQLTVLSRPNLFKGTVTRHPMSRRQTEESSNFKSIARSAASLNSSPELNSIWPSLIAVAALLGAGCGYFAAFRMQHSTKIPRPGNEPDTVQDDAELAVWKDQAKALQRRLDYVSQEIEETVRKLSETNNIQNMELRQELARRQKSLEAWDELIIDYLDGVQRAIDHHQVNSEIAGVWSRAQTQILQLSKRLGLDEIRPIPGEQHISNLHRIEVVVGPTEQFKSGVVTRVIEPGYRRGDAVIRQAKVEIALEKI